MKTASNNAVFDAALAYLRHHVGLLPISSQIVPRKDFSLPLVDFLIFLGRLDESVKAIVSAVDLSRYNGIQLAKLLKCGNWGLWNKLNDLYRYEIMIDWWRSAKTLQEGKNKVIVSLGYAWLSTFALQEFHNRLRRHWFTGFIADRFFTNKELYQPLMGILHYLTRKFRISRIQDRRFKSKWPIDTEKEGVLDELLVPVIRRLENLRRCPLEEQVAAFADGLFKELPQSAAQRCIDEHRKKKAQKRIPELKLVYGDEVVDYKKVLGYKDPFGVTRWEKEIEGKYPSTVVVQRESLLLTDSDKEKLRIIGKYAEPILTFLYDSPDATLAQIASAVGCSINTAWRYLHEKFPQHRKILEEIIK
ncbi:MAG TPA: hypothetical protein EYP59_06785 [Thiotrichaceae bacterium]|nr:hypothetical protein [Thiotrichaceae bacterium]